MAAGKSLMKTDLHWRSWVHKSMRSSGAHRVVYSAPPVNQAFLSGCREETNEHRPPLHGGDRHSMRSSDLWLVYSAPPVNQAFLSGCREETNEHRPPLHGGDRHSMSSSDLWLVYSAPPVNQAFLSGCREETNEDRPPLHGGDETLYEIQWSMTCVLSSSSEPGLPQWLQGRD